LFCWGDNATGQLGQGDTEPRIVPTPVESDVLFRSVACGGTSACAIDEEHRLRCWGDNLEGKPGQADPYSAPDITRPAVVGGEGGEGSTRYAQVAIGQGHVCAIDEGGALFCWGRNTDAALGIGLEPPQTRAPMRVGAASTWVRIAGSQHSSCGIRSDGSLWCWGRNNFFELAQPELEGVYAEPTQVGDDLNWLDVSTGWFHTCALRTSGELKCWGRAIEGQLGQGGGLDPVAAPVPVASSSTWARVAAGHFHTCGVTTMGELMCWGAADSGELGLGDDERRYEPTLLP
jgi:alpha-tubulin suppressor-like RCC1 family protein